MRRNRAPKSSRRAELLSPEQQARRSRLERNVTMNAETLKKKLAEKHDELARAAALDDQSRQLLRDIMSDVEGLGPSRAVALPPLRKDRLEDLAIGFEAEHPTLAAGLREFGDLLAKAGL
jgi:hypothetical protein